MQPAQMNQYQAEKIAVILVNETTEPYIYEYFILLNYTEWVEASCLPFNIWRFILHSIHGNIGLMTFASSRLDVTVAALIRSHGSVTSFGHFLWFWLIRAFSTWTACNDWLAVLLLATTGCGNTTNHASHHVNQKSAHCSLFMCTGYVGLAGEDE